MSKAKAAANKGKKRAQRATSNVFAMFDQAQIQEFKEAFNMIDQNHDGFIDKDDLHDMLASLGMTPCIMKSVQLLILHKLLIY
jgi:Ca2+-binding EF-hand superfamily protein